MRNRGEIIAARRKSRKSVTKDRLEAVLWDMDGVIADTGPYHLMGWHEVFGKRGLKYSDDDFRRNFGKRNDDIIRSVVGEGISSEEVNIIATEKELAFRRKAKSNLKPFPGAIELINSLKECGIKIALASSAPIENIRLVTNDLSIEGIFDVIVWGREVTEGKPSPQGFLLAARRLGVKPRNCVVIEDSVAGVTAAKRAVMRCLAVTNTNSREKLAEADLVVDTLEKVSVADLVGLFNSPRER